MSTKRKTPAAPPKKRPRGRPSKRTPEICREICDRLSRGEPLAVICRDERMPDVSTVWDWTEKDEVFSQSIARARIKGFDALAAECLEISNTPMEGTREKIGKDGLEITKEDMLGHRRLQIETRLKLLSKWDPKRYGDKIDVNATVAGEIKIIVGGDAS
jgi:transposase